MGFKARAEPPSLRLLPNVQLRPCRRADAVELFELVDANREHLRIWLAWLDHTRSPRDTAGFLQETHRLHVTGGALRMHIEVSGRIAGVCSLENINRMNRHAMIGYWLAARHEGRGLMTRAVRALCDLAFGDLGLHRIEIHCAPENLRSRAIPERLGFRREGQLRENEWLYDHFVDHVVYGMLATDWKHGNR